jgi:hypothetical protein
VPKPLVVVRNFFKTPCRKRLNSGVVFYFVQIIDTFRNMKPQNRRRFIASAALLGTGIAASALPLATKKMGVIHHVFFWLKNKDSKEDLAKLLQGLRTLKGIETVRDIRIGVPASTEKRDVVDNSYSASELLFFDDLAGQKTYQDHPIHQKFIADCAHLWERVVVYDTVDA